MASLSPLIAQPAALSPQPPESNFRPISPEPAHVPNLHQRHWPRLSPFHPVFPRPALRPLHNLNRLYNYITRFQSHRPTYLFFDPKTDSFKVRESREYASPLPLVCLKISEIYQVIVKEGSDGDKRRMETVLQGLDRRVAHIRDNQLHVFAGSLHPLIDKWIERSRSSSLFHRLGEMEIKARIFFLSEDSNFSLTSCCERAHHTISTIDKLFHLHFTALMQLAKEKKTDPKFFWQLEKKQKELQALDHYFENFEKREMPLIEKLIDKTEELLSLFERYLARLTQAAMRPLFEDPTPAEAAAGKQLAEERGKIAALGFELQKLIPIDFRAKKPIRASRIVSELTLEAKRIEAKAFLKKSGEMFSAENKTALEKKWGASLLACSTLDPPFSLVPELVLLTEKVLQFTKGQRITLRDIEHIKFQRRRIIELSALYQDKQALQRQFKNFIIRTVLEHAQLLNLDETAQLTFDLTRFNFIKEISKCAGEKTVRCASFAIAYEKYALQLIRCYETIAEEEESSLEARLLNVDLPLFQKVKELTLQKKRLFTRLFKLKSAVLFRHKKAIAPEQQTNQYLNGGICLGAAFICAENRLVEKRLKRGASPIDLSSAARFMQATHHLYCADLNHPWTLWQVGREEERDSSHSPQELFEKTIASKRKADSSSVHLPSTLLHKESLQDTSVDLKKFFGKESLTVEEFILGLGQFQKEWEESPSFILSRNHTLHSFEDFIENEEAEPSRRHAVFFGLNPFEISDVNFPGSRDFTSDRLTDFSVLALGYFAVAPAFDLYKLVALSHTRDVVSIQRVSESLPAQLNERNSKLLKEMASATAIEKALDQKK